MYSPFSLKWKVLPVCGSWPSKLLPKSPCVLLKVTKGTPSNFEPRPGWIPQPNPGQAGVAPRTVPSLATSEVSDVPVKQKGEALGSLPHEAVTALVRVGV